MKKLLITLSILLAFNVSAGDKEASGTVMVSALAGNIIISLSGSNTSCGKRYFFKPDNDYNRALLSMVLSAQMANKKIWVNGSGNCETAYPYNKAYKLVNMLIYP